MRFQVRRSWCLRFESNVVASSSAPTLNPPSFLSPGGATDPLRQLKRTDLNIVFKTVSRFLSNIPPQPLLAKAGGKKCAYRARSRCRLQQRLELILPPVWLTLVIHVIAIERAPFALACLELTLVRVWLN